MSTLDVVYANAQRIASELIAEIASEWKDAPTSRCIRETDHYIFEFVLQPRLYMRFSQPFLDADSLIRFNPLPEAIEIVKDDVMKLHAMPQMDSKMKDYIIRRDSKAAIRQMLTLAPQVFADAIWQGRILAGAVQTTEMLKTFGRPDLARGVVNSTLDAVRDRLKKCLPRIPNTRNPKINQSTLGIAVNKFFPKFKETGQLPSQRQFAKAMDVTPKAWRNFLASHGFDKHEVTIKEWYEYMLARESDPNKAGDFPLPI